MLVIGHRRFLPSLEKNQFSVCLHFFSCFKFYRLLYILFLCCRYCFEIWNQAETRWPLGIPPYQQQSHLPPSPPTSVITPSSTPSATPVLPLFPAWLLFYLLCVEREIYFPLFWCILPHIMGLSLLAWSRGESLIVNFKKSLTRTFVVFFILRLPYNVDFSSIL